MNEGKRASTPEGHIRKQRAMILAVRLADAEIERRQFPPSDRDQIADLMASMTLTTEDLIAKKLRTMGHDDLASMVERAEYFV